MQAATYEMRGRLGSGGYGEVYLATQSVPGGLSRKVAIKVLREDIDDSDEAVLRLMDEGKMLAHLSHPCVVAIHELTRIDGRLALITEYIEGTDISRHCKADNLLPERLVWHIGAEIASVLDCVWNMRSEETHKPLHLVHRDIKPANIRIGRFGEVKLLDFGIARTTEMARHAATQAGILPFTPGYVPPEVYLRGDFNHTTDMYALGCTLYQLLAGRFFYRHPLAEMVALAVSEEDYVEHLERRLARIPNPDGQRVLRSILAYRIEHRPSIEQVSIACENLVQAIPGPSMRRWAREHPPGGSVAQPGPLTGRVMMSAPISTITPAPTPVHVRHISGDTTPVEKPYIPLEHPGTALDDDRTPLDAPVREAVPEMDRTVLGHAARSDSTTSGVRTQLMGASARTLMSKKGLKGASDLKPLPEPTPLSRPPAPPQRRLTTAQVIMVLLIFLSSLVALLLAIVAVVLAVT